MSKNTSMTITEALLDNDFSFLTSFADANELSKINQENARLLFLQRELRKELDRNEKNLVSANIKYKNKYRESYVSNEAIAKNETHRKILSELDCMEEEIQVVKFEQLVKEFTRKISSVRDDLNTLKNISFIIRAEMQQF